MTNQVADPAHPGHVPHKAHPRGLYTLFFTEMWERFSYYGMRALLVLYMTAAVTEGGLEIGSSEAGAIYGLFVAAVYLLALPGGWVADRLIGQQRSVWYGGILIAAGNLMLAAPSPLAFYPGLAAIAFGTGMLKPNVSTIVGDLYKDQPSGRRDAGFSIFYMGINLGAFLAPIVAGTVAALTTWRMGFLTAGLAMVLGLTQYRITQHHLGDAGREPHPASDAERRRGWMMLWGGLFGFAVIIAALAALAASGVMEITKEGVADVFLVLILALAVFFFGSVILFGGLDTTDRKRVGVIAVFFLAAALFWAGFEQAATTFNLFARDLTDRSLLGSFFDSGQHPAAWYQSINPVFIILFSPFFAWVWVELGNRNLEPSTPAKFSLGLIQLGLGFIVMMVAANLALDSSVLPGWLLLTYLLHTTGELCLSPIGLSAVTKLSPHRYVGQMMGTWFLGAALGNLVAGRVGGVLFSGSTEGLPNAFLYMSIIGIGAGILMLALSGVIRKMMGGVE